MRRTVSAATSAGCLPVAAHPYRGRRLALLTQHGKERVIAPVLEPALGCRVERVAGYDTDALGTFTRETPRAGTQLEAARRKARIGMELSALPLGLASEGSFGADPFAGVLPWNLELVILLDDGHGIEVIGTAQAHAMSGHVLAATWDEAAAFARRAGFPAHHLVVRPERADHPRFSKGIRRWAGLEAAFRSAAALSAGGRAFIETDLRAHANPTRRGNIRRAAEDLLAKLCSLCPACGTPGYGIVERIGGLPCADCGEPTREVRAERWGCLKCDHGHLRERTDRRAADPGRCDQCNP